MVLLALAAFGSGMLIDILTILYIVAANRKRALLAANLSVIWSATMLFGVVNVASNHWLAVPYLTGGWAGALLGMYLKKRYMPE